LVLVGAQAAKLAVENEATPVAAVTPVKTTTTVVTPAKTATTTVVTPAKTATTVTPVKAAGPDCTKD
jgi:hypothetical protein